jgi:ribosome-associated translation inhibitor RaiA
MNDFEKNIKQSLSENTPDVLNKIKQSHRFKIPEAPQKKSIFDVFKSRKFGYSFASAFMLVILAIVFINQPTEQIYASTVTIDINPQIEITLDEDDKVINVVALNDDGTDIVSNIGEFKRVNINTVLEHLVNELYNEGYLENTDNYMMVYVQGENIEIQERIQQMVEAKVLQEAQKYSRTLQFVRRNNLDYTPEELQQIKEISEEYNIHPGRIILIIEIRELDDSYTVLELKTMSVRELNMLYETLSDQSENPGQHSGN